MVEYHEKNEEFDIPKGQVVKLEWAEDDQQFTNLVKALNKNIVECDENVNEV